MDILQINIKDNYLLINNYNKFKNYIINLYNDYKKSENKINFICNNRSIILYTYDTILLNKLKNEKNINFKSIIRTYLDNLNMSNYVILYFINKLRNNLQKTYTNNIFLEINKNILFSDLIYFLINDNNNNNFFDIIKTNIYNINNFIYINYDDNNINIIKKGLDNNNLSDCFINCILQILRHTNEFYKKINNNNCLIKVFLTKITSLLNDDNVKFYTKNVKFYTKNVKFYTKNVKTYIENSITYSLYNLYNEYNNEKNFFYKKTDFRNKCFTKKIVDSLDEYGDPVEFLNNLLCNLDEEIKYIKKNNEIKYNINNHKKNNINKYYTDILNFKYSEEFRCDKCKNEYKSDNTDIIYRIYIIDDNVYDLVNLINNKIIHYCNICNHKNNKVIKFKIYPDILCINFIRFKYSTLDNKMIYKDNIIKFNENIHFYNNNYNLYAVCCFNDYNKHYWSYIKLEKIWYTFNDNNITNNNITNNNNNIDSYEDIFKHAYILFYRKNKSNDNLSDNKFSKKLTSG